MTKKKADAGACNPKTAVKIPREIPPPPSEVVSGWAGGLPGRTRPVCVGPVPAAAYGLAGAAGRGAGGGWRGGAVGHAGHADRAHAPLGGALRSLCLGTAGQGSAAGLWHGPALVLSGAGRGSAVLDFGSADSVFVFFSFFPSLREFLYHFGKFFVQTRPIYLEYISISSSFVTMRHTFSFF